MIQQRGRRIWAAIVFCCLLAAAAALAASPVLAGFRRTPVYSAAADAAPTGQAVLVVGSVPSAPSYALLRASLASAGLPSGFLPAGSQMSLEEAVAQTADLTGCARQDLWLVGFNDQAEGLLKAARSLGIRGLALIDPSPWPTVAAPDPLTYDLVLLAGPSAERAPQRFFETITGEDATVFDGVASPLSGGIGFQSSDGRVSLVQLSGLSAVMERFSPPLLAELAAQIRDRQPVQGASALMPAAAAAQTALAGLARLAAACLLLLLAPLAVALAEPDPQPEQKPAVSWSGELSMSVAALLLAASGAWLAERLGTGQPLWPAVFLLLYPGWQAWLHILWRTFVVRPEMRRGTAGQERPRWPEMLPAVAGLLLPVLLGLVLACLPGLAMPGWRLPAFGVLILFNLPLGPGGRRSHPVRTAVDLALPLVAAIAGGWPWLAAGYLFLAVLFWGRRSCRALQVRQDHPGLAAIIQAASVTLLGWAILLP
ncbi:MAG: hypothetical protein GX112_07470 [Clostridiaceae bacterium]|nr:hypothetical protein [Clostridiaceae bacterium]